MLNAREYFIGKKFRNRFSVSVKYPPNKADQSRNLDIDSIMAKFRQTKVQPIGNSGSYSYDISPDLSKLDAVDLDRYERSLRERLAKGEAKVKSIQDEINKRKATALAGASAPAPTGDGSPESGKAGEGDSKK